MGKRRGKTLIPHSHTLPSSPSRSFSSSSSSSDFEFTISLSPLNKSSSALCVADELFYKGQLLPLQLSPRLSMVRTLLASSSSSASDSATTSSRDSSGSSTDSQFSSSSAPAGDCDSSRPSSVTEDDEFRRLHCGPGDGGGGGAQIRKGKYFLSRFSSVFRKEHGKGREAHYSVPGSSSSSSSSSSAKKRVSATAKEVIRKYLKKVKPLYEKLSQKQQQQHQQKSEISPTPVQTSPRSSFSQPLKTERTVREIMLSSGKSTRKDSNGAFSNSFSGNLRYPRKRSCASSCPSSMRSSPSHSGVLCRSGFGGGGAGGGVRTGGGCSSEASSMEELQSAIQGAIAHCKNSMLQNNYKVMVSNEI
ncbi:probable membrane-associated kinase regulator 1 [Rhodamnia argentea]|uniref:Probable membrane-associated kinase regulator 1 n=1 Tax=Rhodamnia argentea TaxID=178133 RepID=A0A8B8QLV1_9MYRT|nr:probable membrane-associated kinase regulator 1 [Rhodamnia argentea]